MMDAKALSKPTYYTVKPSRRATPIGHGTVRFISPKALNRSQRRLRKYSCQYQPKNK